MKTSVGGTCRSGSFTSNLSGWDMSNVVVMGVEVTPDDLFTQRDMLDEIEIFARCQSSDLGGMCSLHLRAQVLSPGAPIPNRLPVH